MEYFLQVFGGLSLSSVVVILLALGFLAVACYKLYKFIVTQHDFLKDRENSLEEMKADLVKIKETNEEQNEKIKEIIKEQKDMKEKQEEYEKQTNEFRLNKLRDELLQSYRYYTSMQKNPMQAWSEMEKEAFEHLFKDYEKLGGNGFMHLTVQPAMAQLSVVKMDNDTGLAQLMGSRQG